MGGKRKSTIYCLGSQSSEYYNPSPQHNVDKIQDLRQKITQQKKVINDLRILTECLFVKPVKILNLNFSDEKGAKR